MKRFREFIKEGKKEYHPHLGTMWHGSPSGDLRGGISGLHLGTKEAAKQALTARIGHPVDGDWDGTREYGKTKLAGKETLKKRGQYLITGHNVDAPNHDYYAHEHPKFPTMGSNVKVEPYHKPEIAEYKIIGKMSNTIFTPHKDFHANGYMKASLKKGNAKRGFYYKNEGEDYGSISAVVPGPSHIERVLKDNKD